jgi:hypothetical protein
MCRRNARSARGVPKACPLVSFVDALLLSAVESLLPDEDDIATLNAVKFVLQILYSLLEGVSSNIDMNCGVRDRVFLYFGQFMVFCLKRRIQLRDPNS